MAKREDKMSREEETARMVDVLEFLQSRSQKIVEQDKNYKARTVTTSAAREQLFFQQLVEAFQEIFKDKVPAPKFTSKPKTKTERILNVVFSDTHYGARLDAREVGRAYGAIEEARRTAAVCRQVADYKRHYRGDTELYVHLLGDMIQGQLYDKRDGAPKAEQVATAARVLIQAIAFLAREFPKGVTVFCSTGNHGRDTARHKERAVNQKWDSIETMLYIAIREALAHFPNVKVIIPLTPYYTFRCFDKIGYATHGDTVLMPGFPGKAIQVESVTKQINSINAAAARMNGYEYSLFMVGHVHTGSMTWLPGAVFMTNGTLIPPDQYAESVGYMDTACGQQMFESVPGHIVGDARFIQVDESADNDASLDQIIKPFSGI
jgi:hypothetical protein